MLAKSWGRSPVVLAVLSAAVVLSGCSLLKGKKKVEAVYDERPVEQLYAAGADKLDHHEWSESVGYFKEVERQHPYSEWSRRSILMEIYAHYEANQYPEAVADANRFIELYPGNPTAAYAYYIRAECYFEQIMDVGRDQATTLQAQTNMREVYKRFPTTEYAADARLKLDMISDQLAGKEMTIGRYYLRAGDTLSAIGRFKTVVDKYQTTSHTPEALYRLVEAYLTLGLVEEAKRNAAVLGYNFPGDPWYADAYKLMSDKGLRPDVVPVADKHPGLLHRLFNPASARGSAPPPPIEEINPVLKPETASDAATDSPSVTPAPAKKKKGWFGWF